MENTRMVMEAASKFLSRNSSGSRHGGRTGGMVAVTVSNNGIELAQLSKMYRPIPIDHCPHDN